MLDVGGLGVAVSSFFGSAGVASGAGVVSAAGASGAGVGVAVLSCCASSMING